MKTIPRIKLNSLKFTSGDFRKHYFALFKFLVCTYLVCYSLQSVAQTISPPLDSYISISNESATIYLEVADTTVISEIEVQLSTKQNLSDIFQNVYAFDQTIGLQNGMTYSRTGNAIHLGTGTIQLSPVVFSKIRLKNQSNVWSEWYEFVSN